MNLTTLIGVTMAALLLPLPALSARHEPATTPLEYRPGVTSGVLADDPAADGRRVEVVGDLATADHVAVLVPGADHDTALFPTADGVLGQARLLFDDMVAASAQAEEPTEVAVVAWLGYDTPERMDLQVALSDRAVPGAAELARFSRVLTDLVPEAADTTWLCHSYGTVVCGRALRDHDPVDPDAVVLLASAGTDARRVADLDTTAEVWAARTTDDPVRLVPNVRVLGFGHGRDPLDPEFGATAFDLGSARGHSGYYTHPDAIAVLSSLVRTGEPTEASRGEQSVKTSASLRHQSLRASASATLLGAGDR